MLITEVDEDNEPKSLPIIVSISWIYTVLRSDPRTEIWKFFEVFLGPSSVRNQPVLVHGSLVAQIRL